MITYYYFSKCDPAKELVSKTSASGQLEAAEKFAKAKRLSLSDFLAIYTVVESPASIANR